MPYPAYAVRVIAESWPAVEVPRARRWADEYYDWVENIMNKQKPINNNNNNTMPTSSSSSSSSSPSSVTIPQLPPLPQTAIMAMLPLAPPDSPMTVQVSLNGLSTPILASTLLPRCILRFPGDSMAAVDPCDTQLVQLLLQSVQGNEEARTVMLRDKGFAPELGNQVTLGPVEQTVTLAGGQQYFIVSMLVPCICRDVNNTGTDMNMEIL
jgi:hypothetical protein